MQRRDFPSLISGCPHQGGAVPWSRHGDPAVPVSFAGNHRALARASGGRGADGGRQANKRTPKRSSMARGINKAILVGNLGNDPETKYTQGGMAITKISLATTSVRKDRDGNSQENTQWHRVTFFGKLGEIAGEYLRKGSQVYVEGEIRYDKYTGQDGVEKYFTEIRSEGTTVGKGS